MTKITINPAGSIRVEGSDFELYDIDGNKFDLGGRERIKLCRCGRTKDTPFCDSSHREFGFNDGCRARALPPITSKK